MWSPAEANKAWKFEKYMQYYGMNIIALQYAYFLIGRTAMQRQEPHRSASTR